MRLPPALLTLPAPGDRTFSGLRRKLRLLALRSLLTLAPRALSAPTAEALRRLRPPLVAALERSPAAVLDAAGSPDVLPFLLCLKTAALPAERCVREGVPNLLAALAERRDAGAVPESMLWTAPIERLVLPSRGGPTTFRPPARSLVADPSGLAVEGADGARSVLLGPGSAPPTEPPRAFPVPGGPPNLHLACFDTNPLAMVEAHPDKDGNALDLGGRAPEDWTRALGEALGLVRAGLPTWYDELPLALDRVVPVGFFAEQHRSASYAEAPGLAYLSLHPDPLTMAEALVHETQHGKLNTLIALDPLLRNGRTTYAPSPVRPDERPLAGVLLAAHAFVPVAVMHLGLARLGRPEAGTPGFARRRTEVLAANADALATLERLAEPTPTGARLLDELKALHRAVDAARSLDAAPVR